MPIPAVEIEKRKRLEKIQKEIQILKKIQALHGKKRAIDYQKRQKIDKLNDEINSLRLKQIRSFISKSASMVGRPLKHAYGIYRREAESGRRMVENAYQNPGWWKTPAGILIGTAQYVGSPITAAAEGLVGDPTKESLEQIKVPKGAAAFVGKLTESAVYMIPLGGTIKGAMLAKEPGLKAGIKVGMKYKGPSHELAEEVTPKVTPKVLSSKLKKGKLTEEIITQPLIKDVTAAADEALKGNLDESQRIFSQIADRLRIGEINPEGLPEILKKHNLTSVEFARMYKESVSTSGRILGWHGAAAKRLRFVFKGEEEALAILDDALKQEMGSPNFVDKFLNKWASIENTRRALLVGQMATAMRNAWSQAGRISLATLDEAIEGVYRKTFGVGKSAAGLRTGTAVINEARRDMNSVWRAINKLPKDKQDKFFKILDENHAVISKMRLLSQPVHEVQLGGKLAKIVNTLNRFQEMRFRHIAFEAKLRQKLKQNGLDYNKIKPKDIPEGMLEDSVNYALEMTFAANPKSKALQKMIQAWSRMPFLTTIQPFPRFNYANAIPFIYEHSPLGFLHMVRPSTIKKLASGDVDEFAKLASRATTGTMMLDSAMRLRQSEHAGERWYEIKIGKKTYDTRAFAPFSTYLFLAELMAKPERVKPKDWTSAIVGLNRIAGTGLVALDWIRGKDNQDTKKKIANFVGQYGSSFFTPVRTASDFYAGIDPEEAKVRDYREDSLIAPILLNFPKYSQMVPEKPSPLKRAQPVKGEPVELFGKKIPAGVFRQLTGFSSRVKTVVEKEIDEVGLPWKSVLPATGIAAADRAVSRKMAPKVEDRIPLLTNTKMYKDLPVNLKRLALSEAFRSIRDEAKHELMIENPSLYLRMVLQKQRGDIKKELKQYPQILQYMQ